MSAGTIDTEIDARLGPTLVALERIRVLLHDVDDDVSIPGVVVAGAQSAGKSSVLEALGGMKLPRGENITTRVPLVMSLQAIPGSEPHAFIGGEAGDDKGTKISIDDISSEIEKLTTKFAGAGGGVSATPIHLRIVRPSGPTLTLMDLPGIAQCSADSSQEDTIHEDTVSLVTEYIKNKDMVILVVVPATEDFATAEAIKLAKQHDKEGKRTLGVVTKMDRVDDRSPIRARIRMEPGNIQLKLGFIGVVNRTPGEVEDDTPVDQVRAREKRFFDTDPVVAGLEKEFWGMDTLVARIVDIQAERVNEFVPRFVKLAKTRIKELTEKLGGMPPALADDRKRQIAYDMAMLRVTDNLKDIIANGSKSVDSKGGTDKNIVPDVTDMYEAYASGIREEVVPDFFGKDYSEKVGKALKRVKGLSLGNLLSGRVFDLLFRDVFADDLAERSMGLVEKVRTYMQEALRRELGRECAQYPALLDEIDTTLMDEFMGSKEAKTMEAISNTIKAELGWAFTQDPLYKETSLNVQKAVASAQTSSIQAGVGANTASPAQAVGGVPAEIIGQMASCDNEEYSRRELQVNMYAYTDVICRHMFDAVPKQVHFFLVNSICGEFMEWMLEKGSSPTDLEHWLAEDKESRQTRAQTTDTLEKFKEGLALLIAARALPRTRSKIVGA